LIKHTFLSIANGGEHSLPLRIIKKEEKEVSAVVEYIKWDMRSKLHSKKEENNILNDCFGTHLFFASATTVALVGKVC
jgi:hypothetical protein